IPGTVTSRRSGRPILRRSPRPRVTTGCRTCSRGCPRRCSRSPTSRPASWSWSSRRPSIRRGTMSGSRSTQVSSSGKQRRRAARAQRRDRGSGKSGAWYPRWYWPSFAAPATLWMLVLFLLPFYVVVSIAFGTVDPVFQSPLPVYEPWFWTTKYLAQEWHFVIADFRPVEVRTLVYVVLASAVCLVIAYTVAYYVSRYGGRRKGLFLGLLIAPFFISYLMRMLSWVELLQPNGYVNRILSFLHLTSQPINWLGGVPFTVVMGLV